MRPSTSQSFITDTLAFAASWLSNVYLPSCQGLKLRHMYEAMDLLHAHAEQVEKAVFFQTADLFNLELDLIFYDTTTASFSVDYEDDPERHAKEGFWPPQVVVALAVTREGIPVRSWVLPGNTSDVSTVEQVRAELRCWNLGRAMFVADSGMNSEGNRKVLAKACGMANVAEIKRDVLSQRGPYTVFQDNLQAKEVIVGDGERRKRYVLCYNPKEAERQKKHRQMIVELLEAELARHQTHSATAQWAIELFASRRFKRYLRTTKSGQVRMDCGAIREAAKYDGKWVIETHVKICVLALMIERIAKLQCGKPLHKIRRILEALQVTEFFKFNHRVLMRNELPPGASKIFKS